MNEPATGAAAREAESDEMVTVRLVMPDRWLQHVVDIPAATIVEAAKQQGLKAMLLRDTDDPADYYVEYAEKRVSDETASLKEIGFRSREILSIRAYDLGHHKAFEG